VFDVVLVHPQIPPNAGNVMRLCANSGARLHLVAPLGFDLDDAKMRRAGLDYRDMTTVTPHDDWDSAVRALAGRRMFAFTAQSDHWHTAARFAKGDVLVFGRESTGLPDDILGQFPAERRLRIPMVAGSRSLNLSNSVALGVYEAWRQLGFAGAH
jgi:tRNA (cytidine/uridine-2'-O-)-methyltransferase